MNDLNERIIRERRESEEEQKRLYRENLEKVIEGDKKKILEKNFPKFPFLEEDFISCFGKSRDELHQEWLEFGAMDEDSLNLKKREFFQKFVPEINYENLAKYYSSRFFVLSLFSAGGMKYKKKCLDEYFFDYKKLNAFSEGNLKMILPLIFFSKNERPKKILEYGCGRYFRTLTYLPLNFEVTFADMPHSFFQFQKKSIGRYFSSVKFVDLISDSALQEKYDYIICQEVLEHVLEPEKVLKHLIDHLNEGGIMWLSVFMDDMNGKDLSHLKRNTERYNNPDTWHAIVEKNGLKPLIYTIESGVIKGWYKPRTKFKYK